MLNYKVAVRRIDSYSDVADIEANSPEEARKIAEDLIETDGWGALFGDEDGDYLDSVSEVAEVVEAGREGEETPTPTSPEELVKRSLPQLNTAVYGVVYEDVMGGVSCDLCLEEDDGEELEETFNKRTDAMVAIVVPAEHVPMHVIQSLPETIATLEELMHAYRHYRSTKEEHNAAVDNDDVLKRTKLLLYRLKDKKET